MPCACKKTGAKKFLWYDPAKPETAKPVVYNSEIEAKAKVLRKQGTYIPYNRNVPIGTQIAAAEALARQQRG